MTKKKISLAECVGKVIGGVETVLDVLFNCLFLLTMIAFLATLDADKSMIAFFGGMGALWILLKMFRYILPMILNIVNTNK